MRSIDEVDKQLSYLIIGNGITGVTAAEILRSEDPASTITIVADDPFPVYYRPALKDYLAERVPEEKLWARPSTFYQEQRVRFVAGRVTNINTTQHLVRLQNGQTLSYQKLLLANGARPRRLSCPGLDLAGVSTLRTVSDYQEILRRLKNTSRVVICGSGTLALESAELLNQRGYKVTHLLRRQTLWSEILDTTASDLVLREEKRAGIDVHINTEIQEIVGKKGLVSEVVTTSGARLPCDMVLIAIGIDPITDFLQGSNIAYARGIKVDANMCTTAADIYAAGDATETTDSTGRTRVIGQWYPAIQQARIAARSMLGQLNNQPQNQIDTFYNATSLHGLDFVGLGLTIQPPDAQNYQEIVAEPKPRSYRKVTLRNGIPLGALFLGERQHALAFKRAIDHRVNLLPVVQRLFAEDFKLDEWLDSQGVPEVILSTEKQERQQQWTPEINSDFSRQVPQAENLQPAFAVVQQNRDIADEQESYLVPVPHPQISLALGNIRLEPRSQEITIGRQATNILNIDHVSVSRRHAEITYENGAYIIRDIGSSNGTFLNKIPLIPNRTYQLKPDDLLRFGDIQFQFQLRQRSSFANGQEETYQTSFPHMRDSELTINASRQIPPNIFAQLNSAPTLIIMTYDAEIKLIPLEENRRFTLGRGTQTDIKLRDKALSRQHAEIFHTPDGFYVRDLNSSYGTFVNKIKINNAYHLTNGDRVVIGNTLIYCAFPQPEPNQTPSQATMMRLTEKTPSVPKKEPILEGVGHRTDIQLFSERRITFEIDMCIGCDRCMAACPIPMSSTVRIADLNQATISSKVATHVERFTNECIMCGSCVPVCPVDNHRDLLMFSLKQRLGSSWESEIDMNRLANTLPQNMGTQQLLRYLRQTSILNDSQLIPDNYLLHIAAVSKFLILAPETLIIREGEYGRDLYILLEGCLVVSSSDASGEELPITLLQRGEFVGDYGMLTGQPHNTTAKTQTPSLLMQIPEQAIQRLMELVPKVRRFFEQANNIRSIESILKRISLFQGVADADIHTLAMQTQVKQYDRNERLFAEDDTRGRPARETLHILLQGFVKVARQIKAETADERVIAYRQAGDYFAGGLDLMSDGRAVTVTTITRTRVAEIQRQPLRDFLQRYPEVNQRFTMRLQQYIESTAAAQSAIFDSNFAKNLPQPLPAPSSPALRAGLHSLVSDGVVEGTEVLVIDLDKCIHCNECEEACARRHGQSRINRKGMVVGNISIATACRQCQDPVCMLCSRAGIARLPNGEVYITESCIGCGICAERCPYGAISIVDVEDKSAISRSSWERFSDLFTKGIVTERNRKRKELPMANVAVLGKTPTAPGPLDIPTHGDAYEEMRKKIAIKCDLCTGYKDQACVEACPSGAALRVQPTKFFGSTEEILKKQVK